MLRSWNLGKAFGIDLFIHWSFWLLPAFVSINAYFAEGTDEAVLNLALVLSLFGCVLLHELGHALTARHYGIPTKDITLYPIGGVARLQRLPERPWQEFWVTFFGPAVNVAIAGLLAVFMTAVGWSLEPRLDSTPFAENFFLRLFWMNIGLVIFNLMPAFPMDGGRILRSLLAMVTSRLRATQVAVCVGVLMAFGFAYVGLFLVSNPMLAFLGVMVVVLGRKELGMIRRQDYERMYAERMYAPRLPPEAVLDPDALPQDPHFTGYIWNPRSGMWVEWRDGHPVSATVGWDRE